ncbi:MAG: hypothetical protein HC840_11840 [Leptolyngbyaceae cyanobacterium RM2_2_4]|nr:hypothetical protein [Leptolyngbyaceae cyanobacterium RM2_2_4]
MTKINKINEPHWLVWIVVTILAAFISSVGFFWEGLLVKDTPDINPTPTSSIQPSPTPSNNQATPAPDVSHTPPEENSHSLPPSPQPPSNSDKEIFFEYVSTAKTALESMKPDLPVMFPLGVNHPLSAKRETTSPQELIEVIGYLDEPSGQVKNLTPAELIQLLDQRADVLYDQLSERTTHSDTVLTVDLIAYKPQTQQFYVLSNVDASDVLRDVVNAVLNGELRENMYDTSNLPLNR